MTVSARMRTIAAAIVVSIGAVAYASHKAPVPPPSAAPTHSAVLTVTTQAAASVSMQRTVNVTGTVYARDELSVGAEATGLRIDQVLVEERDMVHKGQVLAVLDSSVLEAQLEQTRARLQGADAALSKARQPNRPQDFTSLSSATSAAQATVAQQQANLAQAQASLDNDLRIEARNQVLVRQGFVSIADEQNSAAQVSRDRAQVEAAQHQIVAAQEAVQQARSHLQMAQIGGSSQDIAMAEATSRELLGEIHQLEAQLAQTRIVAPDSGLIVRRDAHIGDITAGKSLFTMVRQNQLEVRAQVPQSELVHLARHDLVHLKAQGREATGRIWLVTPSVDASTRLGIVRVMLPPSSGFLPGMFVDGMVDEGSRKVVSVPMSAVQGSSSQHYVFVYDNGVARRRDVVLGQTSHNAVEITAGITPGVRVIVDGAAFLNDRDAVAESLPRKELSASRDHAGS